jgi:hypothetical protein
MTDSVCSYAGDRDDALVTYLYDDNGDVVARATFEAHLATCLRCADDLAALRGVRTRLSHWSPPEPRFGGSWERQSSVTAARANPESPIPNPGSSWWREVPAWAQVAAALLFLGVSAGVANLDVRYDANGLSVRTGWMKPAAPAAATLATPVGTASQANFAGGDAAPWRADLIALERQLKSELRSAPAAAPMPVAAARGGADGELLRRVRALIDDSEKRQQRELALRLGEAIRDVNAHRQADLMRVESALGTVQNRLGVQVLKNAQQMQQMDYLIRTTQRQ